MTLLKQIPLTGVFRLCDVGVHKVYNVLKCTVLKMYSSDISLSAMKLKHESFNIVSITQDTNTVYIFRCILRFNIFFDVWFSLSTHCLHIPPQLHDDSLISFDSSQVVISGNYYVSSFKVIQTFIIVFTTTLSQNCPINSPYSIGISSKFFNVISVVSLSTARETSLEYRVSLLNK